MLEYAKKHEAELINLFHDTAFDPFYDFHRYSVCYSTWKVPDDTWNSHDFVSTVNGKVIGYIGYSVKRSEFYAESLNIIHFGGKNAKEGFSFGKDVMTAIKDIFERYKFIKLKFVCVIGNPVEKTYDKLIARYGGRIVGIHRNEVRLLNGSLYDVKGYEISAEEYFASMAGGSEKE
jgi:hypothetical protein